MSVSLEDASGFELITAEHLAQLTDLTAHLYAELRLTAEVQLSLTLVDETQMAQLHQEWMALPGPTDVMSFPMDELTPGTTQAPVTKGTLGDIVICPAVAQEQAEAAGHPLGDELCLLATHGMLHLLGYDHQDDEGRAAMFSLQRQLLETFLGRRAPVPTESDPRSAER